MAFGLLVKDQAGTPISQNYVPGVGFVALKGSSNTNTDASSNTSSAAAVGLDQSFALSATLQSAQASNGNGTVFSLLGMASVVFTVNMTGFTGTVNFEGSEDNTNYSAILVSQLGTSTVGTTVVGSTTTSIVLFEASCANLQSVRARTSGVSAGNVTVTAHAIPQVLVPRAITANIVSSTNTQTVSGTVTANAGTNLNTSALALESGGHLAAIDSHIPALGQAAMANSSPVVIASDQSALPINYPSTDITILASAARTTTQTSADQTNAIGKGIRLIVDVTNAGTGSITATVKGKDPASGKYYTLLAGSAIVTTSTNIYVVYPGLTAAANSIASDVLPRTFQILITANNANTITYSVGATILL